MCVCGLGPSAHVGHDKSSNLLLLGQLEIYWISFSYKVCDAIGVFALLLSQEFGVPILRPNFQLVSYPAFQTPIEIFTILGLFVGVKVNGNKVIVTVTSLTRFYLLEQTL